MGGAVKNSGADNEAKLNQVKNELTDVKHKISSKTATLGNINNQIAEKDRQISLGSTENVQRLEAAHDAASKKLLEITSSSTFDPTSSEFLAASSAVSSASSKLNEAKKAQSQLEQLNKDKTALTASKATVENELHGLKENQTRLTSSAAELEQKLKNPPSSQNGGGNNNGGNNSGGNNSGGNNSGGNNNGGNNSNGTTSDQNKPPETKLSSTERDNLVNSNFLASAQTLKDEKLSGLGLTDSSVEKKSSTDANAKEDMDKKIAENEKADGKKTYYAKDVSPENDCSDIAVVGIDRDKDKDSEKTKETLKAKGFEKLDPNDENGIAVKFAKKCEENKKTETDVSNRANDGSDATGSTTENNTEPQKELSYADRAEQLEKEKNANGGYKDDGGMLEVVEGHKVKYVKVNGSDKIKYPVYENIMGLPPLTIFKSDFNNTTDLFNANIDSTEDMGLNSVKEYFLYNTDELLNNSFPTLVIHPLDVEYIFGTNGSIKKDTNKNYQKKISSVRYNVIDEVTYKFAVTTGNNISYSHQNNYAPDSIESGLKSLEQFGSLARQGVNLAQTTAGAASNNAFRDLSAKAMQLGGTVDNGINQVRTAATGVAQKYKEYLPMANALNSALGFTQSIVGGGRIDFPDAWQDSKTDFQQQFSIDLRTLNPDPNSDTYFYELLLPLYILLTLSLPTEGNVFSYKTPPLITCSLDESFMEIKLGAITNISWSFETKEMNFKKVPYHCHIELTIRDLYSVMSQATYQTNNDKYVDSHNSEIMTKDEYIRNFVKTKDKKVPNEKYYLTEFAKIPAYMAALERKMAKEQASQSESKKDKDPNGADKGTSKQPSGTVAGNSGETGKDTSNAPKKEEIKTDPKTGKKTLISSIGGFVTGITKGIRNVVAGVNKFITPVRQIINTGATVLNAANNVKCAIKCVGQTANLPGLLNGSFAASVGLAFENLGKAGNVLEGLSGGVLGSVTKSVGGICTTLSELGRSALVLDLPEYVSKDGKTIQLNDPFKVASSTMRATGLMVSNILNTVQGAKMIGDITKSSDPLATLTTYVNAANKIVGEVDFTDRLLNVAKGSAIETGQYTAGQLASNATIQERFRHVANTVSGQAASVASTMFNTTLAEYMMQQQWFNTYFQSTNNNEDPSNPVNIKDIKYKDEIKAAIDYENGKTDSVITPEVSWSAVKDAVMDNIDGSIQDFSKGVKEFANTTGDILIKSGFSGVVNTAGTPFDVIFMENK